MPICFVMQPFDGKVFDDRFRDTFKPAIENAGLEAYRVDQDPSVSVPIADIEKGIRDCHLCLAEITQDNPNVWFELGYAIACRKEVVLVCSEERTSRFPFDVQHRTIIRYSTGSKSDYEALEANITQKIKAYLAKSEKLESVSQIATQMSKVAKVEGLEVHEIVCLAALAENLDHPSDHASAYIIKRDMEASGFTKLAATIALASLMKKNFIESTSCYDHMAEENYTGYTLTESGWSWVLENKDQFTLTRAPNKIAVAAEDENPF